MITGSAQLKVQVWMGISLRKLTEREVSRNGQFLVGQDTGSCVAEGDLVVKVMVPSLPLNIGCLLSQPHVLYLCLDCFQFSTQLGFMEIIDCLPCYYQWHLYDFYVVSSPSLSSFPSKKKKPSSFFLPIRKLSVFELLSSILTSSRSLFFWRRKSFQTSTQFIHWNEGSSTEWMHSPWSRYN